MNATPFKALLLCALLAAPPLGRADTVQLNPGTLVGSVALGSETITSGYIYAYTTDGFSANSSFSGNTYSLTVGGDKNWVPQVNVQINNGSGSSANMWIYRNTAVTVPIGQTVQSDFAYPASRIQGQITVIGGTLSSYSIQASGNQNSESYTTYAYFNNSGAGSFSVPMVSGIVAQVNGSVTVTANNGQATTLNLQAKSVQLTEAGAIVNWTIDLNANSGSITGNLAYTPSEIVSAYSVHLSGSGGSGNQYISGVAGAYSFAALPPGQYQVYVYTYFTGGATLYTARYVTVSASQATVVNFDSPLAFARQGLAITGSRQTSDLSGAFAYAYPYDSDSTGYQFAYDYFDLWTGLFDFALPPGRWYFPYVNASFQNVNGYTSLTTQDSSRESSLIEVVADQINEAPLRTIETSSGEVVLDVFEAAGNAEVLISNAQISASGYDPIARKHISLYAYTWGNPSAQPSVQFTGVPGTYNAVAQGIVNGSWTVFGRFPLTLSVPETTPVGQDVVVAPSPSVEIAFSNVTSPGVTTVTQSEVGPQEPSGFQIFGPGGVRIYYDLKTTATFEGPVEVCFEYVDTDDGGDRDVSDQQEKNLKLLHYEAATSSWVNITTGHDPVNNRICGSTPSFSIFAIAVSTDPIVSEIELPIGVYTGDKVTAYASFKDPDPKDAHTAIIDWGDGASSAATVDDVKDVAKALHIYTVGGTYTVTITVSDLAGNSGSLSTKITVKSNNNPPVAKAGEAQTIGVDGSCAGTVTLDGSGSSDPDKDALTYLWTSGGVTLGKDAKITTSLTLGVHKVLLTVTDSKGASSSAVVVVTVVNEEPSIFGGEFTVVEGGSIVITPTVADTESLELDIAWDIVGDGKFTTHTPAITFDASALDGPATYLIPVRVTDTCGAAATDYVTIHVLNSAPVISSMTGPVGPLPLGSATTSISALFSDAGALDQFTAIIDWGDGSITSGSIAPGVAAGEYSYTRTGVFPVKITITDDDGAAAETVFQYVVIYDPVGGFVTGGGWIISPVGAYTADPSKTGKASFGFVSKYQRGATVPSGDTQFQFHAGDLVFKSLSYDWLVISGTRAQYKGSGRINGAGDYGFLLTAVDGQKTGVDLFRLKIWQKTTGEIVYDNQMGSDDTSALNSNTALGGGSIVIHNQ